MKAKIEEAIKEIVQEYFTKIGQIAEGNNIDLLTNSILDSFAELDKPKASVSEFVEVARKFTGLCSNGGRPSYIGVRGKLVEALDRLVSQEKEIAQLKAANKKIKALQDNKDG